MTSSISVGTGLVSPLGVSNLAKEYANKFGKRSGVLAFPDFIRARDLSAEEVAHLRAFLKSQYHIEPVATRIESKLSNLDHFFAQFAVEFFTKLVTKSPRISKEKGRSPASSRKEKKSSTPKIRSSGVGSSERAPTKTGFSARQVITPRKPKKTSTTRGRLIREGLGFSTDSDGSGGGVSGGSPMSSTPDYRIEPNTVGYKPDPKRSLEAKASKEAVKRLRKGNPLPYETVISNGDGVKAQTKMGYVRVPGGPVSVNEQGRVSFKRLTPDSVEINVGGVATTHQHAVLAHAIRHRLSPYGHTFNERVPKVLEWLWYRSSPGESLVLDPSSRSAYVINEGGYKSEAF